MKPATHIFKLSPFHSPQAPHPRGPDNMNTEAPSDDLSPARGILCGITISVGLWIGIISTAVYAGPSIVHAVRRAGADITRLVAVGLPSTPQQLARPFPFNVVTMPR